MAKAVINVEKPLQLLLPDVTVERLGEKQPQEGEINIQEIAQRIQRLAAEELQNKGMTLTVLEFPRGDGNAPARAVEGQEAFSQRLVRVNLTASAALDLLREACGESTASAILVHSLQVKMGPKGGVGGYGADR